MTFGVYVSQMLENIFNAKMRSFLAVLGIMVGTASVVALVSGGELATRNALVQFEQLGTNLLSVGVQSANQGGTQAVGAQVDIQDLETVKRKVAAVKYVAGYTSLYQPISYAGNSIDGSIVGATEALAQILRIKMHVGRFVSNLDKDAYYCVLGKNVAASAKQHGGGNLLGRQISVGSNIFTVIGVMQKTAQNPFMSSDLNDAIIVPLQSSLYLSKYAQIRNLIFRIQKNSNITLAQKNITKVLNEVTRGKKFFFRSSQQILKSMDSQHRTFTWMLGFIGSISLLVGGIGVMNIMLVSVTERRREIGIRRAIGARSIDIQYMFILESIGLTMFGGFVGVLVGVLASFIIADFAGWSFHIFPLPPVIGFLVSVLTGIFFGFYPAFKASKLNPIDALRSD